ncbi:hypothetical protein N7541_009494 [Penicillium brevicompactum]|uniref:Uncharacterized protein n=1 Tax=Penicillium brevicompactum TaxID=5074 RepID=A0A9W9UI56_PENBR|nr:hypothetical protein N7541_009494 [Penicillium brevicompactum]
MPASFLSLPLNSAMRYTIISSSLLYGNNCFDLTSLAPKTIPDFLDAIGLVNASHLECIRIGFPEFCDLEDEVSLEYGSLRTLKKIQAYCTNLKSISTTASTTYFMEIQLNSVDSPTIYGRALALVADHFRAITSLQEIVMEVHDDDLNSYIRSKMQSHGWILKVMEPVEEEEWVNDRIWDEIEDDYLLYDDEDDDNDDDYDIDNDSDIWRRAAD